MKYRVRVGKIEVEAVDVESNVMPKVIASASWAHVRDIIVSTLAVVGAIMAIAIVVIIAMACVTGNEKAVSDAFQALVSATVRILKASK